MAGQVPYSPFPNGPFRIDSVTPSGGPIKANVFTMLTLSGIGLSNLERVIYKPKFTLRNIIPISDTVAHVQLPCQQLGNAHIHKMSFNLFGGGDPRGPDRPATRVRPDGDATQTESTTPR